MKQRAVGKEEKEGGAEVVEVGETSSKENKPPVSALPPPPPTFYSPIPQI